ncbi:MAG TPA: PHB depolymerase family esterase [Thermoanaerobaculales bacterium]|nr:PHB depolymerase family esterase [Thermoanaerobaculales bacterium]HQL31491.1 PHB depolymerase family esterase [Thermoanaerobaculales bacterium]
MREVAMDVGGGWSAVLAVAVLAAACASSPGDLAAPSCTGFVFGSLELGERSYPYALYVPRSYDASRTWPVVLFLHGKGECGRDGSRQISVGLGPELLARPERWPFLVLLPQKPEPDDEWEQHEAVLLAMLDEVAARYQVDPGRVLLTGLSQGGHGTWVLGARHPGRWAALVPICGYATAPAGPPAGRSLSPRFEGSAAELAPALAGLPIWAFHGEADDTVPVAATLELVEETRRAGGSPRLTVLPGVGHNSWVAAYRDPELAEWMLQQVRRDEAE